MKKILFLTCNSGKELGKKILEKYNNNSKLEIEYEEIEDKKFLCGETNIIIKTQVVGKEVYIIQDVLNLDKNSLNDNLMSCLLAGHCAKNYGASSINFIIPYFPYGREDRLKNYVQNSVSLSFILQMFENLSPKYIITVDIHNQSTVLGLRNTRLINIDSYEFFLKNFKKTQDTIFLPTDFSGSKKLESYSEKYNIAQVYVGKNRDKENNIISSKLFGDVSKKNVLIMDDIIDSGQSIFKILENVKNAKSIDIFATHGLFTNNSSLKFIELNNSSKLNKLYYTNSTCITKNLFKEHKFAIEIDITNQIFEVICSLYEDFD